MKLMKRLLCFALALIMVLGYIPGAMQAQASQEDGICEKHHPQHTQDCGYIPAVQGKPCAHDGHCNDDCLTIPVEECIFSHENCECKPEVQGQDCDGSCELALQKAAVSCNCPANEDGTVTHNPETCDYQAKLAEVEANYGHNDDCGYAVYQPPVTCSHVCTVDNGCIVMTCSHGHSEECGYSEGTEGEPCKFAGEPCVQCEAEKEPMPADGGDELTLEMGEDSHFGFGENSSKLTMSLYFGGNRLNLEDPGDVTIRCEDGVAELLGWDDNGDEDYVIIQFNTPNVPVEVVYTVDGAEYFVTVKWEPSVILKGQFRGNQDAYGYMSISPNWTGDIRFYLGTEVTTDTENGPLKSGITGDGTVLAVQSGPDEDGYYRIQALKEGEGTITYEAADGTKYFLTIMVERPDFPILRIQVSENEHPIGRMWQVSPDFESERIRFFIATDREYDPSAYLTGEIKSSNEAVISVTGPDDDGYYTVQTGSTGGSANLTYQDSTGSNYQLQVVVKEIQYRLLPAVAEPENNRSMIDLSGVTGPVDLRCYLAEMFGPPVGNFLTNVSSSDKTVFTLSMKDESRGIYTLTPVGSGRAQLVCVVDGKTYTSDVAVMDKNFKADGLVYYPAVHGMSGKTYPKTVANISVGDGIAQEFYYSEPAEAALLSGTDSGLTPLTIDDVDWSGPIDVVQPEGETKLHIIGTAVGTGYLEVTSEDGITHCFVVNVGMPAPNEEVQEGGYMWLDGDTLIGFGNPGIASDGDNDAEAGVLKLRSQINNGFDSSYPDDYQYREPMCFAAMDEEAGKPDVAVMEAVRNVRFSVLACQNTDNTTDPYPSVELKNCEQIELAENGVKAWTNYLVAGGKEAFRGLVGMTFDLPDTKTVETENGETEVDITRRISLYVLTHNTYMGEDVTVLANIETAAQLNVILSSYEALKTWIKAEYPEYRDVVDNACNVNIKLPGGDFTDTLVVSETIAPFPFKPNPSSNPNFRIYLRAPRQGKKATLAGLVSRGCLAGIVGVNFEATEGVNMTYEDEEFTCGLMADDEWDGTVVYDMDFADKYGIDPYENKRSLSDWQGDHGMKEIDCDIMTVDECSFTGFDYGTRSTKNGYVGSGSGNSFHKCFFGIYIDCPDKEAGFNITYTGFSGYDFKKNVVAVRIVELQEGMTPYKFRIHDCDFINNYLEFWIDKYDTSYLQNYYFYRNHYSGGWNKVTGQWYKYGDDTLGNISVPVVSHRGPKYHPDMNNGVDIFVSGSPSSITANLAVNRSSGSEGYWIYDGEDQVTRIELDGDTLPIAQKALESLEDDAEISVVDNMGEDTVAVWSFEGGE